jgi:hypothetical protein
VRDAVANLRGNHLPMSRGYETSIEREMAISARATNRITTAPSGYCGNGVSTSRRHQAPSMLERNMEGFFGIDWGRHDRRRSSALLR